MKLNQHGWSAKEMIILCSVLLSFLFIAIFFIVQLYSGLNKDMKKVETEEETKGTYSYEEVEENLLVSGLDYYNEYYADEKDVKITSDKLKLHKYITNKELSSKEESKPCSGYVLIEDGVASSFIKCANYKTNGYGV